MTHLHNLWLQESKRINSRQPYIEMPLKFAQASKYSKMLHDQTIKFGVSSKGFMGNAIVDPYSKCCNMEFAEKAFNRLNDRDISAWNSLLSIYSKRGLVEQGTFKLVCLKRLSKCLTKCTRQATFSTKLGL